MMEHLYSLTTMLAIQLYNVSNFSRGTKATDPTASHSWTYTIRIETIRTQCISMAQTAVENRTNEPTLYGSTGLSNILLRRLPFLQFQSDGAHTFYEFEMWTINNITPMGTMNLLFLIQKQRSHLRIGLAFD